MESRFEMAEEQGRAIVIREDAQTDPAFGKVPQKRSVEEHLELGIVNLDKPAGPTSHQISAWVKDVLKAKKAGHSGTLDPDVSGVLPIGLNRATRSLYSLLPAGKEYVGVMHLHSSNVKPERLAEVVKMFAGKTIMQKPPVRSAVRREFRPRTIHSFEAMELDGRDVLFYTRVQAGTYIRKLCHDMGTYLGGAHMAELRRTKAGPYDEKSSVCLHDLADAYAIWKEDGREELLKRAVLPVESAAELLPKIWVKDGAIEALCQGANLAAVGISKFSDGIKKGELLAVFSLKGEFVALGNAMMDSTQMASEKRGWAADTKRVVMKAGTYPKMWKTSGQQQERRNAAK